MATKPVMISVPWKFGGTWAAMLARVSGHCTRRSERSPFDYHDAPRVEPGYRPGAARALLEKRAKQPCRPHLAVTGDQVADTARRGARLV